jgi:hypothetical protein
MNDKGWWKVDWYQGNRRANELYGKYEADPWFINVIIESDELRHERPALASI